MACESCGVAHDGVYGSGRFCSPGCARAFSTKAKRKEINEKVSKKVSGRPRPYARHPIGPCSPEHRANLSKALSLADLPRRHTRESLLQFVFIKGGKRFRRRHVAMFKDLTVCEECGLHDEWNGKPITMQVDHVNGDDTDNRLDNLRVLCPNCHTQTPTWGSQRRTAA
jgi:5-methylcytosine-specific restriction endonuclease McrA